MTYFAGIDPGLSGALAVVRIEHGGKASLVWWSDMPTAHKRVGKSERRRYVLPEMIKAVATLAVYDPVVCAIEDVQGRGGQVGGAQLSYGVGLLHMACETRGLVVHTVTPSTWKAVLSCPASKPRTVRRAEALIPGTAEVFRGPRGGLLDGRAEAALLAYWAWNRFGKR